jgi:hypothetical protein
MWRVLSKYNHTPKDCIRAPVFWCCFSLCFCRFESKETKVNEKIRCFLSIVKAHRISNCTHGLFKILVIVKHFSCNTRRNLFQGFYKMFFCYLPANTINDQFLSDSNSYNNQLCDRTVIGWLSIFRIWKNLFNIDVLLHGKKSSLTTQQCQFCTRISLSLTSTRMSDQKSAIINDDDYFCKERENTFAASSSMLTSGPQGTLHKLIFRIWIRALTFGGGT